MDSKVNYYNISLYYLGIRARTVHEMRSYLTKKGADSDEIDRVISKLTEKKFLDDREFAIEYINSKSRSKNRSRKQLEFELAKLGVEKDQISEVFDQTEDFSDLNQAINKLTKKYRNINDLSDLETKKKALAFLSRSGFSYSVSKNAIDELTGKKV